MDREEQAGDEFVSMGRGCQSGNWVSARMAGERSVRRELSD